LAHACDASARQLNFFFQPKDKAMSETQRNTQNRSEVSSDANYPRGALEIHETKAPRLAEAVIEAGNLVIMKVEHINSQLWACESALTIDVDFEPKQVSAFISDLCFDRGSDSIKISKLKSYVASASVVPNQQQVRVVYGFHICDDSGTFAGGHATMTLFVVRTPPADEHGRSSAPMVSMIRASDLRPLSITGRYAYALTCVERLCAAWNIGDPYVRAEIDAHWQATEIKLACHWFDEHPFPRSPEQFRSRLSSVAERSDEQIQALHQAFYWARRVCLESCYCGLIDNQSLEPALRVARILARWGVELPLLERFRHATWSGKFYSEGWGERLSRSSFVG
jgi:hypothetical protein